MNYRLGLDIGTNSIGWAVLEMDEKSSPGGILDSGVRIFSDGREPKSGESTAVKRRTARGIRHNRDRYLKRRDKLLKLLVELQLLPEKETDRKKLVLQDPYALRAQGSQEKIELYQLGRALFHLQQRRGFKSNRKTDRADSDNGITRSGIEALRRLIAESGAATYGDFLYHERIQKGLYARCRKVKTAQPAKGGKVSFKDVYEFYPDRELIAEEIDVLWTVQAGYYPELTAEKKARVKDVILFQRKLKPQVVGKCTFERDEDRAAKALPLIQQLRIFQEVNNLRLIDLRTGNDRVLEKVQRDILAEILCRPKGRSTGKFEVKFDKLRQAIGAGDNYRFNLESENWKGLEGDTTSALLSHKDRFGAEWYEFSEEVQTMIISVLNDNEDAIVVCLMEQQQISEEQTRSIIRKIDNDELVLGWLQSRFGVSLERAQKIAFTNIADDYGSLGLTAARKILTELRKDVITFDKAVVAAGYKSHCELSSDIVYERLPYYGIILEKYVVADKNIEHLANVSNEIRYGKIGNPTVHIVLNQLRKVVNEIIKEYGKPSLVNIEVLRELKNGRKTKNEYRKKQADNTKANEKYRQALLERGIPVNSENMLRMRLLHEMREDRRICVYSGENISIGDIFSDKIEVDHILPFSRTLDDSIANKILCCRHRNREKGNKTPYEVWGSSERYEELLERASVLPANKRWRFKEDAMKRYELEGDFIARQLTDTQYITRCTRQYLDALFTVEERRAQKVTCIPGRLTGLFRKALGMSEVLRELRYSDEESAGELTEKVRNDHRNHALDAILIAVMDRSFLQRAASHHAQEVDRHLERFLAGFADPWDNFRESIKESVNSIIVSHRTDHGLQAQLHNDTAYGVNKRQDKRGNAVHRVPVETITRGKDILAIKGKRLRAELVAYICGVEFSEVFEFLENAGMVSEKNGELKYKSQAAVKQLEEYLPVAGKELEKIISSFFAKKRIRNLRIIEPVGGLIPINNVEGEVYKFYKPDSNAYYDIYQNTKTGKWEGDIVPTYYANLEAQKKIRVDTQFDSDKYRKIARVFNNDMLELTRDERVEIYRVVKMSQGVICLAEHNEANAGSRGKDSKSKYKLKTISPDGMRKAGVRFIKVTPRGKVRYLSDKME